MTFIILVGMKKFIMKKDFSFKDLVLRIVQSINCGCVLTYGKVAELAGRPGAARAVGAIMRANKDPRVPCHRVVSAVGLGGYNRGRVCKLNKLKLEGVDVTMWRYELAVSKKQY